MRRAERKSNGELAFKETLPIGAKSGGVVELTTHATSSLGKSRAGAHTQYGGRAKAEVPLNIP